MERQPRSQRPARASGAETQQPRFSSGRRRPVAAATVAVLMAAVGMGFAQEEIAPEPAIMAALAPRALALDVTAVDDAYVAVGERGHILISTDDGATWQQAPSPTRTALTAVSFVDREHGWAVGHDSAILRTTDGGLIWELVNWAPEDEAPLFDVWFSDIDNGFAIGAYGTFYVTSDGGVTWEFEPISDADFHLHAIARAPGGNLFIAAEAGTAYRSDDGGVSWAELPSPYEGSFFGVLPLDDEVVLLFGLRGHVFRSSDAGESWEPVDTGTVAMLTDGIRLADGTVVMVGLGGTVLVSRDGGVTFELHQQANRRGISAIVETADGSLVMSGEFGVKKTSLGELTGAPVGSER